jgi:hypothetical protein
MNPSDQPDARLTALRELLAGYAGWESWRGVSGLIYVRRRMCSPPAVYRGWTAEEVARQVVEWEEAHPF